MKKIYKEIANGIELGTMLAISIYTVVVIITMLFSMDIAKGLILEALLLSICIPVNVCIMTTFEIKAENEET